MAYYREMATAAVWVDNARKAADIVKRKDQYYIQTWHGMVALKQIEKDAQNSLSVGYLDDAKNDSKMADLILSGCGFFTKLCRRAFWYDGEILECGSPRLDVLFQLSEEKLRSVKAQLGIGEGKKVILYAPTFRANGNTGCYIQNYEQILSALKEKTGEDWVFAVRLHPNVANKAGFIAYSDRLINATVYPDLYELIPMADIVISDYSSLMFDSALIRKPVFLYATDIAEYTADRNFYFDIEKLPFPLARSSQELLENMLNCNEKEYLAAVDNFNESLDYYENGTASETVANKIMEVLSK
jgi:CDP-glycerol glycerophosphotransferase